MHARDSPRELQELCLVANFVEVTLAREGHRHPVGINYLEKIQPPHLPSLYGARLAGVGYVLMGAGIPLKVPEDERTEARIALLATGTPSTLTFSRYSTVAPSQITACRM
jgi:NAD(P)H-dependent flavin oxidoreductase YrpB (nitropropane dioxygenase family)